MIVQLAPSYTLLMSMLNAVTKFAINAKPESESLFTRAVLENRTMPL